MRARLVIARNPFDPFDRQVTELRRPMRIRALAPRGPAPVIALLNGRPVLRHAWRRRVRDGEVLSFHVLPLGGGGRGSNPLRFILSLALVVFAPWAAGQLLGVAGTAAGLASTATLFGTFTVGQATALGIYLAGSALINALLPNPTPRALPNPSPTYSLQAQGNAARLEAAIPVQYGRMLAYPDFAAQPYTEFAGGEQYLFQLLCLGCGEYDIEELRIEDTPITSFAEVETQIVPPGQPVTLFPTAVTTSVEVSGQDMPGRIAATWAQSGTTVTITETDHLRAVGQAVHLEFTTGSGPDGVWTIAAVTGANTWTVTVPTGSGSGNVLVRPVLGGAEGFTANAAGTVATRLGVDVILPRGLYTLEGGGGIASRSLSWKVEGRRIDDLGAPLSGWVELGNHTLTDRTTTPIRQSFSYTLATPGRWQVRAWRLDEKSDGSHGDDLMLGGLRAYLTESQDFGPVTLIALRMRATNNLSAQASRRIAVLSTRKVPVWTGSAWSAPVATRSIAWALADAARNTAYGARLPDSRLDIDALAALDAIWTARGDEFNARFDEGGTWWDAATRIARAGRARVFFQGGILRVVRDGPASVPVALYSMRNIRKGSFAIDYILPSEETADTVEVAIFDSTIWAPRRITARLPGSTADRPVKIDLFGVTSADQALREGLYEAASNRLRRRIVRFATEMEGFIPAIGDLIAIQHEMPGWGASAEVTGWDAGTRTVTLSEPMDWTGPSHVIGLRRRDGSLIGPISVTRGGSDWQAVLIDPPDEAPYFGADAVPTHAAFGRPDSWRALAKVASIRPRGLDEVEIEAVVEDPGVHTADEGASAAPVSYSALPRRAVLPVVSGLLARLVRDEPGRAVLSWRPAAGAESYQVELAEGEDLSDTAITWTRVADTTATNLVISLLHPDRALIRVRAIGLAAGPWVAATAGELVGLMWTFDAAPMWNADDSTLMWSF